MRNTRPAALPAEALLEGSPVKPFIDLCGDAIELRTAALSHLLFGIEESDPEAGGPRISNLRDVPLSPREVLVAGDEVRSLRDRGELIWSVLPRPHGRGQTHDGRFGLRHDAVPVMHDERFSVGPSNVLGLPVPMADPQAPRCAGESSSHPTRSVFEPLGSGCLVEVVPVLVKVGPESSSEVVPPRPRRRGRQIRDARVVGCRLDQACQESREPSHAVLGAERLASGHRHFCGDRQVANPGRRCQRPRARETCVGQLGLDA